MRDRTCGRVFLLEAENAQLRGSVVELVLQIQALRDRARTLTA